MPSAKSPNSGEPRAPRLRATARRKEKVEAQREEGRICSYAVALPPPHILSGAHNGRGIKWEG